MTHQRLGLLMGGLFLVAASVLLLLQGAGLDLGGAWWFLTGAGAFLAGAYLLSRTMLPAGPSVLDRMATVLRRTERLLDSIEHKDADSRADQEPSLKGALEEIKRGLEDMDPRVRGASRVASGLTKLAKLARRRKESDKQPGGGQ